mmetsp:Transcript_19108/g.21444  ORF Transcript_19108/g.21444 Transcript_19108/m.21444 type:complete len:126 (+) Transcript_19108:38-415(+)
MDIQGGGLTHYNLGNMKYMRVVYGEGLRVPKTANKFWDREVYFYQKKGYARGYIWHHRSNATQQWLFHFMYGGIDGFIVKRYIIDHSIKTMGRLFFLPIALCFVGSCLGQRDYDNNAYDYFYFSD